MSELVVGSIAGLAANDYVVSVASGSKLVQPGSVLQVVSTTKTDVFTTTSTTFTDITGLSASITPSSTSSKIMVLVSLSAGSKLNGTFGNFRISGGNAGSYVGDAAGSRSQAVFGGFINADMSKAFGSYSMTYLDSPSTTSSVTYSVQAMNGSAATLYVNRSQDDTDDAENVRGASTITLMEIAG